jgi:hypothetical protein
VSGSLSSIPLPIGWGERKSEESVGCERLERFVVSRFVHECSAFGANAAATFELDDQVERTEGEEHHHQQRN